MGTEEVKLFLFTDDIENLKESRKLLKLISDYSKVAGYNVNVQKSIAFNTTNEQLEYEIKNAMPLILARNLKNMYKVYMRKTTKH